MDGAGDELLARARVAFDEHRRVRADRDLGHGLDHIGQGLALGHEKGNLFPEGLVLQEPDFLAEADGTPRPFQAKLEGIHAQWLQKVIEGAALHGRDDRVQILEGP